MKEINKIIEFYHALPEDIACAIATVVHVEGSSYRRVGARMLVASNGQWEGGISGGCLEGDALRKAQQVIFSGKSKIVTYDTREDDASSIGIGLGCNGLIDVLISPINRDDSNNPIKILEDCSLERKEHILITSLEDKLNSNNQGKISCGENFQEEGIKAIINEVKAKQSSRIVELEHKKVLVEYLAPPIHLLIFGGQYDVFPLLQLKELLGWKATLICKSQNTNVASLRLADKIINQREGCQLPEVDKHTVAILMAHDYKTDVANLKRLLEETNLPYIGMLGPKKRANKAFNELAINAVSQERVFAPVGLDTGAVTPEEIAVSIVAEIRSFFSKRKGTSLRDRAETIHSKTIFKS